MAGCARVPGVRVHRVRLEIRIRVHALINLNDVAIGRRFEGVVEISSLAVQDQFVERFSPLPDMIAVVVEILNPKALACAWSVGDHVSKVCGLEVESNPSSVTPGQASRAISRSRTRSTGPSPSHPPWEVFTGGQGEERCKP